MRFSLKPHQLLAHWMPGFVVLAVFFLDDLYNGSGRFDRLIKAVTHTPSGAGPAQPDTLDKAIVMVAFIAVAFALGQFLDAARNLMEWGVDRLRKHKIQWDQIMEMERDRLEVWDDYYFSYYVFDANLALGLAVLLIFQWCSLLHVARFCSIGFAVMMIVLAFDAVGLRCEIKGILDATPRHPKNRRRQSASAVGQAEHPVAEIGQDEDEK
jgi:hypothetical protein